MCFVTVSKGLHLPVGLARVDGAKAFARQFLYGATAFFLLLPAVFGPQDRGLVRRFLRWQPMVYLGLISYGIYLWHQAWIERAVSWTGRPVFRASFPAVLTAARVDARHRVAELVPGRAAAAAGSRPLSFPAAPHTVRAQ